MAVATQTVQVPTDLKDAFKRPSDRLPAPWTRIHDPSLLTLLGPGDALDRAIDQYAGQYSHVETSIRNLLQYPFLENFLLKNPEENLHTIVSNGSGTFNTFSDLQMVVARNIISYATALSRMLDKKPVDECAGTLHMLVEAYANQVDRDAVRNAKTLLQLSELLDILSDTIDGIGPKLEQLTDQIAAAEAQLENIRVFEELKKLLKDVFKLSTSDDNAKTQLTFILGLPARILDTTFGELHKDQQKHDLELLIDSLRRQKSSLSQIKSYLAQFTFSLGLCIDSGFILADIWTGIKENLVKAQTDFKRMATTDEIKQIAVTWTVLCGDLRKLIDAINGVQRQRANLILLAPKLRSVALPARVPRLKEEFEIMKTLQKSDDDGDVTSHKYFPIMAEIVRSPAIKARNVEKALSAVSGQSDFKSNKDTVKKALSPPKGVDEIFDGLSKSTGVINDSFREILQSEWLESLQVANPFEGPGEEKEIDLRKMVMRYQSEYYKLQDKAIEVGRDLITYSITQQRLLPKLGTPASSMTFEKYVEVNGTIVNKYLDKAQELYQFHLDFRRDWQSAQDTVEKSIKELISKISTTKKQLEEAKEELKKKSLIAALTFIGAVVCFAAAALIPGVGVLAVMIGVTLLGTSIQQIISASQLTGVIRGYTDSLNTANTSQQRLEMLKDPMTKIGNDVSKVTGVWSDIVTHLKNIDTAMVTPELLEILRDDVIGDWKNVEDKIRDYIDILNGLK